MSWQNLPLRFSRSSALSRFPLHLLISAVPQPEASDLAVLVPPVSPGMGVRCRHPSCRFCCCGCCLVCITLAALCANRMPTCAAGITVPAELGGLGLGYLQHCIAMEELSRASGSGEAALAGRAAALLPMRYWAATMHDSVRSMLH